MNGNFSDVKRAFKQEFPIPVDKLFKELVWPAAAGNVAWAFLQLLLDPPEANRWPYRTLLLLIAIYLAIDWLRSASTDDRTWKYWWGDFGLIVGIVVLAIATQAGRSQAFLHGTLAIVFGAAAFLHLIGVWEGKEELDEVSKKHRRHTRYYMASCALMGLVILAGRYLAYRELRPWTLPISFGVVLAAWLVARTIRNERNASLRSPKASDVHEPAAVTNL